MLKYFYSIILLLFYSPVFSNLPPDISFGEVSKAELAMTHYALDSTVHAVVLGDYGDSHFTFNQSSGLQVVFTRHTRIKIFDSEGFDWANVYVNLYRQGGAEEMISQIKGYTYTLEDGKVVKTKLKNNGKFREKYNEHIERVKFTLPSVKAGSVIEYSYRISSDFLAHLRDWEFQSSIPTVWSEYKVTIPEYFRYKQLALGYHPWVINERSSSGGTFNFNYKQRSGGYVTTTTMGQDALHFTQWTQRWAAQDVPALTEEPYITTMSDYTSQIVFELESVNIPGQVHENYASSWKKIDQQLLELESFGGMLSRDPTVKKSVSQITQDVSSPSEKMAQVFSYVRDRIKWNEQSSLIASQSFKKTLSEKSGNAADVNLLLVAMLREVGIAAHPVVLSTRDHGMILSAFPRINQFNYVIALARIDSTTHLLDATDRACPPGVLPLRCLNEKGRVVGSPLPDKWVSLHPPHRSTHMTVATLTLEDDALQGNVANSYSQYDALQLRKKIASYSSIDNYIAEVKQSQLGIQQYEVEAVEAVGQAVKSSMDIRTTEGLQQAGNLLYVNPFAVHPLDDNPFKAEARTYPVDYAYPSSEIYVMNLTIPADYIVDELPENLSIALPDQGGRYTFVTQVQGNVLQISSKLDIARTRFYAPEYAALREFYRQMIDKQREQVVLVKQ